MASKAKSARMIYLYNRFVEGGHVNKADLVERFQVSPKSIQRDIDELRCLFSDEALGQEIVYNRSENTYYLALIE